MVHAGAGDLKHTHEKDTQRKGNLIIADFGSKVVPDVSLFEIISNLEEKMIIIVIITGQ